MNANHVRDYGRLWEDFKAAYGPWYSEPELRAMHRKWARLARISQTGEKYR